jgi:hypothetical protein
MGNIGDVIGLIAAIIGCIVGLFEITNKWGKLSPVLKRLLSKSSFAWGSLATILIILGGYIFLSSKGIFPSNIFRIEKVGVHVSSFGGNQNGNKFIVGFNYDGDKVNTYYKFDFDSPAPNDPPVGFDIRFYDPVDLSNYDYLELDITFSDSQTRCKLCLDDNSGNTQCVVLSEDDYTEQGDQTIRMPVKTFFPLISRKSVKEITFIVDNSLPQENKFFTISDIKFRK